MKKLRKEKKDMIDVSLIKTILEPNLTNYLIVKVDNLSSSEFWEKFYYTSANKIKFILSLKKLLK